MQIGHALPLAYDFLSVMPGLVPGIHAFCFDRIKEDVDGRVKPGHDE